MFFLIDDSFYKYVMQMSRDHLQNGFFSSFHSKLLKNPNNLYICLFFFLAERFISIFWYPFDGLHEFLSILLNRSFLIQSL